MGRGDTEAVQVKEPLCWSVGGPSIVPERAGERTLTYAHRLRIPNPKPTKPTLQVCRPDFLTRIRNPTTVVPTITFDLRTLSSGGMHGDIGAHAPSTASGRRLPKKLDGIGLRAINYRNPQPRVIIYLGWRSRTNLFRYWNSSFGDLPLLE